MKETGLQEVAKMDWNEVLYETQRLYSPLASARVPIQPAHSPDFVHLEPGFVIRRRRVFKGMIWGDKSFDANEQSIFALEFAFGGIPSVPDWRTARVEFAEGRYPVATASSSIHGQEFKLKCHCSTLSDGATALWVKLEAKGRGLRKGEKDLAEVRLRLDVHKEKASGQDEYAPYRWDASKWIVPCPEVSCKGESVLLNGKPVGMIVAKDGFSVEARGKETFEASESPLRLKEVDSSLFASASFEGSDVKSFTFAMLVDCENATAAQLRELQKSSFEKSEKDALKDFKRIEGEASAKMSAPFESWEDAFVSLQLQNEQLLVAFPGSETLTPTQGGVTMRHYVWVWEAADMLLPMIRAGRFKSVRKAIESIFTLQDAGILPEGKLKSHEGAIGTTGPRWLNTTGSALSLAAEYCLASKDKSFLKSHLPKILKAARWIVNEIRETRKLAPDGSRPLSYGLMPPGRANDEDMGQFPIFTDAYLSKGLSDAAKLLTEIGDSDAAEISREAKLYRADILASAKSSRSEDGNIARFLPGAEKVSQAFNQICNASLYIDCEVMPPELKLFRDFERYFVSKIAKGPFMGMTNDADKAYVNLAERVWFKIYLRLGEWKKAFLILRSTMNYSIAQDTWLAAERFSKSEPGYVPFQPNGSGNGRLCDILMNALLFKYIDEKGGSVVVLCGGLLPFQLKRNGKVALSGLRDADGSVSMKAEWLGKGKARLSISGALPELVRIPDFYAVKKAKGAKKAGAGTFKIAKGAKLAVFEVEAN